MKIEVQYKCLKVKTNIVILIIVFNMYTPFIWTLSEIFKYGKEWVMKHIILRPSMCSFIKMSDWTQAVENISSNNRNCIIVIIELC